MLLELHVKNLALIEAADVELEDGLNILTGETGAGKSIMIGSVNLALGQKASREMIRNRKKRCGRWMWCRMRTASSSSAARSWHPAA